MRSSNKPAVAVAYTPAPTAPQQTAIPIAQPVSGGASKPAYGAPKPAHDTGPSSGWSNTYEDTERALRMGFVRKVYGILFCQLAVTAATIFTFIYVDSVRDYVYENSWVMWTSFGLYIFSVMAIICCGDLRRRHPHGLICLGLVTVALSVLVGAISASYQTDIVLYAMLATTVVVLSLSIYAFQTKYDFTKCIGMLWSMIWVFIMLGFMFWWFPAAQAEPIRLVYAGFGALLMCFFIVHDTQLMLGGRHKYSIGLDEYVFASLNIYLDIINLFLYILSLLGGGRR